MPMNGSAVEVTASLLLSSRHCVFQTKTALVITLPAPAMT
jgi:hypothetical protein